MLTCSNCNAPLKANQKFCNKCGYSLKAYPPVSSTDTGAKASPSQQKRSSQSLPPELIASIDIHEKKIARDSLNPKLYIDFGDLYKDHQHYEDALVQYQKAVSIDASFIDGHARSAEAYRALGKFERAQDCYEKLRALDPDSVEAEKGLFLCMKETGKTGEAITLGKKLLVTSPRDITLLTALKDLYLLIGNDDEAQKMLETLISLSPDKEIYRDMARLFHKKGDTQQALSYYTNLIELAPNDQEGLLSAGLLLFEKGDTEKALRYLEQLPEHALAQINCARIYTDKGDLDRASKTLNALLLSSLTQEEEELLANAYKAMGKKALNSGDTAKAQEYLEASLDTQKTPEATTLLAGIIGKEADNAFTEKRYHNASLLYEKASAYDPLYKEKLATVKKIIAGKTRKKVISIGTPILLVVLCVAGFFTWRHFTTGVLTVTFYNALSEVEKFEINGKNYKIETEMPRQMIRLPKGEHKVFAKAKEGFKDSNTTIKIDGGDKKEVYLSMDTVGVINKVADLEEGDSGVPGFKERHLSGQSGSGSQGAATRFQFLNAGIITDLKTGLQWIPAPNQPMNWFQAQNYAQNLSLGGGGWRLPTRAELKSIYNKSMKGAAHPAFHVDDKWVWTSETQGESAWFFNFGNGHEDTFGRDGVGGPFCVLAVRSGK